MTKPRPFTKRNLAGLVAGLALVAGTLSGAHATMGSPVAGKPSGGQLTAAQAGQSQVVVAGYKRKCAKKKKKRDRKRCLRRLSSSTVMRPPLAPVASIAAPEQITDPSDLSSARATILHNLNQARASNGRGAVTMVEAFNDVAQDWTRTMATNRNPVPNPNPRSCGGGEAILAGDEARGATPEQAVQALMNTNTRDSLLVAHWTHVGIGFVRTNRSGNYFTIDFCSQT